MIIRTYQNIRFNHDLSIALKEKYTQFHLTVKMKECEHECSKKNFSKVSYTTETAMCISGIWLLVELVRSL